MSELCKYCGIVSRDTCSEYIKPWIINEIMTCPNLCEEERPSALVRAGHYKEAEYLEQRLKLQERNEK